MKHIENSHYVYFIESHQFSHKMKIYISPNYPESKSLECLKELDIKREYSTYHISIYRFKMCPFDNKNEVLKIISEENFQGKNEVELNEISVDKNLFLFDFNSNLNLYESKLSLNEEFEIYISYLKEDLKLNKDSEEFKELFNEVSNKIKKINKKE